MNHPREVIESHYGGIDVDINKVSIINSLHRYIYNKLYYWLLKINFPLTIKPKTAVNVTRTIATLEVYREILERLFKTVKKIIYFKSYLEDNMENYTIEKVNIDMHNEDVYTIRKKGRYKVYNYNHELSMNQKL